jgi:hypothetical protein
MRRSGLITLAFFLGLALQQGSFLAAQGQARPRAYFELGAGPLTGLDRPFRGGTIALGLGLGAEGLAAGCAATLGYDVSLESWLSDLELCLEIGEGFRVFAGAELPLGKPSLRLAGKKVTLEPAALPNLFGVAVTLLDFSESSAGPMGNERPRFSVEAALSWSAYRFADKEEAAAIGAAASGISGFAAGFHLATTLRLRW